MPRLDLAFRRHVPEKDNGTVVVIFIQNLPIFVVVRFHTTFLFVTHCNINLFIFESKKWETQEVFLPSLKNLIAEMLDPAMPFVHEDSDPDTCKYCPFLALCR